MQAFKQWFSARSLPIKIVFILLGAWLAIRVLQVFYANSFAIFLSSLAIFVFLLILHAVQAGSDAERLPEALSECIGVARTHIARLVPVRPPAPRPPWQRSGSPLTYFLSCLWV